MRFHRLQYLILDLRNNDDKFKTYRYKSNFEYTLRKYFRGPLVL